jgi:hypothetical protein
MLIAGGSATASADTPPPAAGTVNVSGDVRKPTMLTLDQPQLVVPGDIGVGRYIRDLTELRVANLAHGHPTVVERMEGEQVHTARLLDAQDKAAQLFAQVEALLDIG